MAPTSQRSEKAVATRLAVVGPFPPVRGGIAHFDEQAAEALEERGHDVMRVPFRRLYPRFVFPGRSQYEPGAGPDPSSRLTATSFLEWRRLGRRLAHEGVDAVIVAYWTPLLAPAAGIIARRSGRPVVGLVHNAIPHEPIPGGRRLARWFLSGCDAVLTLSDGVARDVRELGFAGPIATTPHPVYDRFPDGPARDEARARLRIDPRATLLLFFGLVRAYKGVDLLIEALPAIRERLGNVVLIIAGEWYQKSEPVKARIRELGLEDIVIIEDAYVPDERVALLFSAADMAVLPYRGGTQSGVLETAARYGTPTVVTDIPGLADVVRRYDSGIVAHREDIGGLAAAVVDAREQAAGLAEGARRMAAAHGWGPFCETVEWVVDLARTGRASADPRTEAR